MTAETAETDAYDAYEADAADAARATCWRCGGPCATYKGTVHGWTCTACLDRYLAEGAARADARERARQAKKVRVAWDHSDDNRISVTAEDRRREGGPSYVPHPSGVGPDNPASQPGEDIR